MQRVNFTLNLSTACDFLSNSVSFNERYYAHVGVCSSLRKFNQVNHAPQIQENEDLSCSVGAAGRKPAIMAAETTKSALIFGFVKSVQRFIEHLPLILSTP